LPPKSHIAVPTLFTSLNIFCGFTAVVLIVSANFIGAVWLIFIAAIFDGLDGRIARAVAGSSDFGMYMDSLGDVVSAGLAPALLVYQFHLSNYGHVGLMVAFAPLLFSAFRLARYNLSVQMDGRKNDFIGLPAPMAAVNLCSVVLLHLETGWDFLLRFLLVLIPAVSLLMVSTIRYPGFPRFSFREGGRNRIRLVLFCAFWLTLPVTPHYGMFFFMMIYLLSGPVIFFRERNADIKLIGEQSRDAAL